MVFCVSALEHIKSGGLSLPCRFPEPGKSEKIRNGETGSSPLKRLFVAIEDNDVLEAKRLLESDSPDSADPSSVERMCHPLCDCPKCSEISAEKLLTKEQGSSKVSLRQVKNNFFEDMVN